MAFATPCTMFAQEQTSRDMWDYVTSFNCATGRQYGVATDNEFIYTSVHSPSSTVTNQFYKYDLEGNFIECFDIDGCEYIRDLAFDGQYFYGSDVTNKLYCVDLANKTLIGITNTAIAEIRHCSYDPVNDGFWVGVSTNLSLIDRNGAVITTVNSPLFANYYLKGTGYFTDENGDAHLYLFCNNGFNAYVFDYDIANNTVDLNPIFDFSSTPGWSVAGSAGGAFIGQYKDGICFFGDSEQSPNLIGIYSLGDFTPEPPEPPTGDQFYDFNDGFLRWTTIDADGDGYNWRLNRNWSNPSNIYSAVSESRDDLYELPLTPDNYLVCPFKLTYGLMTFKACAQDAAYPEEHFGVAVSTTGNTDAADFTTIWETTMTAKVQGSWYEYAIDLREYEGQEIWVALRHFGCTDQFMIVVDDITLYREWDGVADLPMPTLSVFPNPATDCITMESGCHVDYYEIYSMTGALLHRQEAGTTVFDIDVRDLPVGVYMIKVNSKGLVQTKRFVKE